jgi:hypothetical protein
MGSMVTTGFSKTSTHFYSKRRQYDIKFHSRIKFVTSVEPAVCWQHAALRNGYIYPLLLSPLATEFIDHELGKSPRANRKLHLSAYEVQQKTKSLLPDYAVRRLRSDCSNELPIQSAANSTNRAGWHTYWMLYSGLVYVIRCNSGRNPWF